MLTALLDNDILLKGICYGLLLELIGVIPSSSDQCGILGTARFVVEKKLQLRGLAETAQSIAEQLAGIQVVEPTADEIRLAAELEALAQQAALNLDHGESLLCAIATTRQVSWVVTGDKRAAVSIARLNAICNLIAWLAERLVCLEQLFRRLIDKHIEPQTIRERVCAHPTVDKALSICFSCLSSVGEPSSWTAGLDSYINDLREAAPMMLCK